jgi:hypothetical protein
LGCCHHAVQTGADGTYLKGYCLSFCLNFEQMQILSKMILK